MSQRRTEIRVINWELHKPILIPPPKRWDWIKPGDWFAVVAKPIARFIDKWFKTHFVGCGPCGRRQQAMNHWPARVILWFKKVLTFTV